MYRCSEGAECPDGTRCVMERCIPVADASPPDASPGMKIDADSLPDATPADAGPPPNLLADPSFEGSEDGWIGYLATTSLTSTNPHSGLHALRICKDSTGLASFYSVYRDLIVNDATRLPPG